MPLTMYVFDCDIFTILEKYVNFSKENKVSAKPHARQKKNLEFRQSILNREKGFDFWQIYWTKRALGFHS
jgi:hypothetical protein